jgi:hypothetical protein
MRGSVTFALVLTMMMAGLGSAYATPGLVVVGGTASDAQQTVVRAALALETATLGWTPAGVLSKAETATLLQCIDSTSPWSCVPPSMTASGVQRVIVVTVDPKPGDGGANVLVLVGKLIATNPESAVVRQRFCERCADDRLGAASAELATQMIRDLAVRGGRTVIDIRSEPPGAAITLDGERVGATNSTFNTYPGMHQVVVEKAGYHSEAREIIAEEGHSAEVTVTLRSSSTRETPPLASHHSRLVPGLVIGAGVVALGTGIALQATKDGPPLGELQPSRIYSAPGIGLAVAGGALVGLGAYLWWRAGAHDTAQSAPSVTLVDGGGVVGWSRTY